VGFLHIYWGLGGSWGFAAALPQTASGVRVLNPGPLGCFVIAAGLFGFAALVLGQGGFLQLPLKVAWQCWAMRTLVFIFCMRALGDFHYVGFFKTVKGTLFARLDTAYYSPLCLLLGFMAAILSWRC
jgi:hypothetical protein